MCAGLLQSVPRGAAECVQGYRVCAGCSFNILPCSTRLNQKIFYWKKKYFIWMCIKNKNYMENWLFWGLNLGNLKQCMMIMLVLTSSSSAWTLCSLLHISSLINICNFYSFWATGMVLTSKWGRILQEIHCQCLLSVNTTDFEKTTIQAHSAVLSYSHMLDTFLTSFGGKPTTSEIYIILNIKVLFPRKFYSEYSNVVVQGQQ